MPPYPRLPSLPPTIQSTFSRSRSRPSKPTNHDDIIPPPPTILFSTTRRQPIEFVTCTNNFHLCQDCLPLHETRYCSGRTERTWETCAAHKDCETDPLFDTKDLEYFREAVISGQLLDPRLYQSATLTQPTDETWLGSLKNENGMKQQTGLFHSYIAPDQNRTQSTMLANHKTSKIPKAIPLSYPQTVFTYLHDDEAGCNYSTCPQQIIVEQASIKIHDDARLERIARISNDLTTLKLAYASNASATLGEDRTETKSVVGDASRNGESNEMGFDSSGDYQTGSEGSDNDQVSISIQDSLMEESRCHKIQAGLSFSSKATFTKRCNGQFVNVLGEVFEPEAVEDVLVASAEAQSQVDDGAQANSAKWVRNESPGAGGEMFKKSELGECDKDDSSVIPISRSLSGITARSSTAAAASAQDTSPTSENENMDIKSDVVELKILSKPVATHCAATYNPHALGIAIDSDRDSTSTSDTEVDSTRRTQESNAASITTMDSSPTTGTQGKDKPAKEAAAVLMPLSTLLARVDLWLTGRVTDEDFILTCWAMNSSNKELRDRTISPRLNQV